MIEAVGLTKRFADGTLALDALSFEVRPGEIYCLLGAAGAGKTTTLELFLDVIRPTSGRALVAGVDANRHPCEAKRHLAYLTASVFLYDKLTAMENLAFFARLTGRRGLGRDDLALAMREVGLPERAFDQRVVAFGRAMRQKLGLAMAVLKGAPALLLDEPTAGLDPQASGDLVESLRLLRDRGQAILLATHNLFHAKQLADRVGILKEGRKILSCSREELRYQDHEALYLDVPRDGP